MAFDSFCPSKYASVAGRTCETCDMYFPTKKAKALHKKVLHPRRGRATVDSDQEEEDEEEEPAAPEPQAPSNAPVFNNIF